MKIQHLEQERKEMGVYLGECTACGEIEYVRPVVDEPPERCPHCGTYGFKALIAGTGNFRLKGCGWAEDHYETVSHPRFDNCRKGHGNVL